MSLGRRAFLTAGFWAGLSTTSGFAAAKPVQRRVVYFSGGQDEKRLVAALAAFGWKQGENIRVELRLIDFHASQPEVDAAAREVVASRPDVIVTFFRERVGAVLRATRTIPVVAGLHDPMIDGFAKSLARPGGNVTGVAFSSPEGMKMTFRLLGAVMPGLRRIHALAPGPFHETATVRATRDGIAAERGFVFVPHPIEKTADAVRVLEGIRNRREEAIVTGPMRGFDHADFAARVLRARVVMVDTTGQMENASLLGAGMVHPDSTARIAAIVDQVLRGGDPANIPFEQPTHLEVIVNQRVASAVGVTFPPEVMMRATKVIE